MYRLYRQLENLRALYHPQGCTCGDCASVFADGDFSNRFQKIPASMEEDFLKRLHGGDWKKGSLDAPIWREYYSRFRQFAEAGFGKKLTDPTDWRQFVLMEQLKRSASTFAGGKLNTLTNELRQLRKLPLKDFVDAGKKAVRRHHRDYLDAELQTTLASANSAAKWQSIEQRAYLYPNLRYETAGDERVRESHKAMDGRVYPVNHSFWDTFMPPNSFRCRCIVLQTDEPTTGSEALDFEPPKGFKNNPGKTGLLFEKDHPYFDLDKADLVKLDKSSEALRAEWETMEVYKLAQKFVGTTHKLPGMSNAAKVTGDFVSASLAAAHVERAIKNDLLTFLTAAAAQAKFIGIEGGTYTYNIVVSEYSFTLLISGDTFQILQ